LALPTSQVGIDGLCISTSLGRGYECGQLPWTQQLATAHGAADRQDLPNDGRNGEPFGYNCSASALGSLYYVSLGLHEPDSAVPSYTGPAGPFQDFQAYLYWSKSPAIDPKQGFVSFSFASGFQGANVFRNYLYVLPMFKGKKDGMSQTSDAQWMSDDTGSLLYDPSGNITWLADANLAATKHWHCGHQS